MRTIIIELPEPGIDTDNYPNVREGDKHAGGLGKDELLGTVASLLYTGKYQFAMRTKEEWAEMRARWKNMAETPQQQEKSE